MSSTDDSDPRLTADLARLRETEIDPQVERTDRGIELHFEMTHRREQRRFTMVLRPSYPLHPPVIYGPAGLLERHQEPYSGCLCVVDHVDQWWRPDRPAADLIHPFRALLEADALGSQAVADAEFPRAEPVSAYAPERSDATVLVPEPLLVAHLEANAGTFRLRRVDGQRLRMMTDLRDQGGALLHQVDPATLALTQDEGAVGGWIALDQAPPSSELLDVLKEASRRALSERGSGHGGKRSKGNTKRRNATRKTRVVGVTFMEEGGDRGQQRRAWVFMEIDSDGTWVQGKALTTQMVGPEQRAGRIPELRGLKDTAVLVVGAGSLGSGVALELAKAGVGTLAICDGAVYEPGNAVRHVLPVTDAGEFKADAVARLCEALNPYITVRSGGPAATSAATPQDVADRLEHFDLIVETTANDSVIRSLAAGAEIVGIPVVTAALTTGGYGGRLVVLRPHGPCFDCYRAAVEAGDLPEPPEGPQETYVPIGCSNPTVPCPGFEITQLAAVTARAAVQALRRTEYPEIDYDWITLTLRGGSGERRGHLHLHDECFAEHGR